MERAYNNLDLKFEKDHLILMVDDQIIRLRISDVSDKLASASESERKEYKISPSGYGINWRLIDEDLSINGLLQFSNNKNT
jgi:hypothetical protein